MARWYSNPANQMELSQFLRSPLGSKLLGVLMNEQPAGYPARGQAINETMAAVELGRGQGYLDCLSLIQKLSLMPENLQQPLEADYATASNVTA